jgi:hypothetical protein
MGGIGDESAVGYCMNRLHGYGEGCDVTFLLLGGVRSLPPLEGGRRIVVVTAAAELWRQSFRDHGGRLQ